MSEVQYMQQVERRFLDALQRESNGCWRWKQRCNSHGYGQTRIHQTKIASHRLAYTLFCGPIPDGMCVLHHCDNPPCCRPDHLFLGTMKDNMQDMAKKKRAQNGFTKGTDCLVKYSGENNSSAKLSAERVLAMRAEFAAGSTLTEIAEKYRHSLSGVHAIIHRKTWRHV